MRKNDSERFRVSMYGCWSAGSQKVKRTTNPLWTNSQYMIHNDQMPTLSLEMIFAAERTDRFRYDDKV